MRRFCLLCALLVCFAALLPDILSDGRAATGRRVRTADEVSAVTDAERFACQLGCMHRCNSDLRLPSTPVVDTARRVDVQFRQLWGCDRRSLRCRVARNLRPTYDEYALDGPVYRPGAGAHAADYYVRTLRRLII